jgi:hypothetical protein
MADGQTLTTSGNGNTTITGLRADLVVADASTAVQTITIVAVTDITLALGTDTNGTDAVTGTALTDGQVLTMTGTNDVTVSIGLGDLTATAYAGIMTVTTTDTGTNVITTGTAADVINAGDGIDIIIGGNGADAITPGAGNDSIRYLALANAGDSIAGFVAGDVLSFSTAAFAVAGLTNAAAGNIALAANAGTTAAGADYFESNTSFAGAAADLGNLSGVNIFVFGETAGTFATSSAGVTALMAQNNNAADAPGTAMLVVYATAAGTYRISYDTNGATADGETVIATLTGIADGAAALAAFSEASFAFGA